MTTFPVLVEVRLRPDVADPQGATIERSLPTLGFGEVTGVRVGKAIRFTMEAPDEASAEARAGAVPPVPHQPGDRGRNRNDRNHAAMRAGPV